VPAFSIPYEMPLPYQTPGRLQEMLECDGRELAAGLLVTTSLALRTPPHLVRKWGVANAVTHSRSLHSGCSTKPSSLPPSSSVVGSASYPGGGTKCSDSSTGCTGALGSWSWKELAVVAQGMGAAAMCSCCEETGKKTCRGRFLWQEDETEGWPDSR
jgi:hypothetical protein